MERLTMVEGTRAATERERCSSSSEIPSTRGERIMEYGNAASLAHHHNRDLGLAPPA